MHLGQGPGDEPDRQQHDEGGDPQPAGQDLAADRQGQGQAHPKQDLICRRAVPRRSPLSWGHKATSGSNLRTRYGLVITQKG